MQKRRNRQGGEKGGRKSRDKKFGSRQKSKRVLEEVTGKVQMTRDGYVFVIIEGEPDNDVFVKASKTRGALNGDIVRCAVTSERKEAGEANGRGRKDTARRREGEIIEIVERSHKPFVGVLHIVGRQAWVLMQSRNMPYDICIDFDTLPEGAKRGMKVAALVDGWDKGEPTPKGHIVDVLGMPGENDTEMHAILAEYALPYRFEPEVENAADQISDQITEKDLKGRRDFRNTLTFTIDPTDAKDFDDAISLRPAEGGNYEVGVHIADVSKYVKPSSPLDREAAKRGNSTYLVGTVIPMLPFKLSNGICSLVEDEDRLVKSVFLTVSPNGNILDTHFANSVIRSSKRLSYEQAHALITLDNLGEAAAVRPPENYETAFSGKDLTELSSESLAALQKMVRTLWGIASGMRQRRMKEGSLDLNMPEFKIFCDKDGYADRIEKIEYNESHQLVEEFMLAANREVSKALFGAKIPYISRVHDEPDPDKLTELRDELEPFGIECGDLTSRREIIKLLEQINAHPQAYILKTMFLRSLKRAEYRASPDGHYGLYMRFYAHFTSPIRRYADLTVHRCFDRMLWERKIQTAPKYAPAALTKTELDAVAEAITRMECNSTEAERESHKIKLMEYFERRIGKGNAFEAIVTSLSNHGFFVDLTQSQAYGFVHLRTLHDDIYHLSDDGTELRGRRTGTGMFRRHGITEPQRRYAPICWSWISPR